MEVVISRTDNIGDVILSLPMAGVIKEYLPHAKVYFLGKKYTQSIIERSEYVDLFLDWEEVRFKGLKGTDTFIHVFPTPEIARFAKNQGFKNRIGTSHRTYHWWTCNHLVNLGRKKSHLHEAQLNLKLLSAMETPLNESQVFEFGELHNYMGWDSKNKFAFDQHLGGPCFNLVFHIKSKGSAKEWKLSNYLNLAKRLDPKEFKIIITGTREEGDLIKSEIPDIFNLDHVRDVTGDFTLKEFIDFVGQCDGLLACSTGPLHIAAASGLHCLGLYPKTRPMHAGRWAPIGEFAETMTEKTESKSKYLEGISVEEVRSHIMKWTSLI